MEVKTWLGYRSVVLVDNFFDWNTQKMILALNRKKLNETNKIMIKYLAIKKIKFV